tara:strand:+ start:53 stop:409 length:357 start_codon:yes stop_codon:yes gene_type:complete
MKANELRVGNLVTTGGVEQYVMSIDIDDPAEHRINDCQGIAYQPIPLTEEWLVRFGFENTNTKENPNYKKGFYICMVREHGINICNNHGFINDLNHVHQLQNLYFALTGEELELKSEQ